MAAIQEYRYMRDGRPFEVYGVAEHWDSARLIEQWVNVTNFSNSNPVDAFDFPLREMLKALCDQYGFSLRNLTSWETLLRKQPQTTVTFVENHDLRDEGRPIVHDKLLAYSYIFAHEGYPCVFWKDYYDHGLALEGTPNGISALVRMHEKYAGGGTEVLHLDDDLYVMQRHGYEGQPGLIYVLNNRGDRWQGEPRPISAIEFSDTTRLPMVLEAWGKPSHPEFEPRTPWSLYNAFTELAKSR